MQPTSKALFAFLVTIAAAQAQRVWIVDQRAGGGHFTDIQAAVDAAGEGDVILVRPGAAAYAAFTITGKGLVVAGDSPGRVLLAARGSGSGLTNVVVNGTRAPQAVVIRNFAVASAFSVFPRFLPALYVEACAGTVSVEDCQLLAGPNPANSGVVVRSSAGVALVRCEIRGAAMQSTAYATPAGLDAIGSTVHLHDCTVAGAAAVTVPSGRGGHGVEVTGGALAATGTAMTGGAGVDGAIGCFAPGDGGDALFLDAGSSGRLLGCALTPGPPGASGQGCPPGRSGNRIGGTGAVSESAGPHGASTAASPVRYGRNADVAVRGPAGALAWLAFAGVRSPAFVPGCHGTLHASLGSVVVLFLGTLPAGGRLDLAIPVPALGLQALPLVVQPGFVHAAAGCSFGAPSELLLVDPRF